MKQNYTHIAMVIDRSGSMYSCWSDVVGGYKEIIKSNKAADGECTFTLALFDGQYQLVEKMTPIAEVSEDLKVAPRGSTALLDAIGKTITIVGEELAQMAEEDRPDRVLFMIQTDGQENTSQEFTKESISKMVSEQTEKWKWNFMFLGANMSAIAEAKAWGIGNTVHYNPSRTGDTISLVKEKLLQTRSAHDGQAASMCYQVTSEEEKSVQ